MVLVRRILGLGLVALAFAFAAAVAQTLPRAGWPRVPNIAIMGSPADTRTPLVHDAVRFWNGIFEQVGSPFRLGAVTHAEGSVSVNELRAMSDAVNSGRAAASPAQLAGVAGEIVIVLSDGDFVSFTARLGRDRALIGLSSQSRPPRNQPNVMRNVVAHELGHAIGLRHSADETKLMCGRPATCRPDAFQSATEHYLPLTDGDMADLARIYPPSWRAE